MCHNPLDRVTCDIVKNIEIAPGIFEMVVSVGGMAKIAVPGQFVNLYCADKSKLLPRPISICGIDRDNQTLRLIYAVVGEGTKEFSLKTTEEKIDVLGPLGTGFGIDSPGGKLLIVGGGVGTPPLLELAKELKSRYGDEVDLTIVLGFRDDIYLSEEFKAYGDVYVATDSGSHGFKGNVIELMKDELADDLQNGFDHMFSCGPTPMLRGLQTFNREFGISGEFSLEERMGCGFGGCVGCTVGIRVRDDNGQLTDEFEYKKVCKDGPVFEYSEVIF